MGVCERERECLSVMRAPTREARARASRAAHENTRQRGPEPSSHIPNIHHTHKFLELVVLVNWLGHGQRRSAEGKKRAVADKAVRAARRDEPAGPQKQRTRKPHSARNSKERRRWRREEDRSPSSSTSWKKMKGRKVGAQTFVTRSADSDSESLTIACSASSCLRVTM
jgi:hypothetical protein